MDKIKLDDGQYEDLEMDLLPAIERNFNFQFEENELLEVESIADLSSIIIKKIGLSSDNTCTSQQAFYKIKRVIKDMGLSSHTRIAPSTKLELFFPKENRRESVKQFEDKLGFKLNILEPNQMLVGILCVLLVISFIVIFFSFTTGVLGIILSLLFLKRAYKFGKNLKYKTVKDLIINNLSDNYLSFRSDKNTINKLEVRNLLRNWFSDTLGLDEHELVKISFK